MPLSRFIIFIALAIGSVFTSNAFAESSVWKISKGDNYFYLGGTVHLLTAEDHPLPDEFTVAYQDSNRLFFETDIAESQTPEFQSKFIAAMTYSNGRTLASELDQKTYLKLESFMASRQVPIASFSNFEPWGVSLMVTMLEYQRLGMQPGYGVDAYFNNLALADKKEIMNLETGDEQLRFLSLLADIDPNVCIEYTLKDLEDLPEFITFMKKSWRNGNIEAFTEHASVKQMKKEFPAMYKALITTRNNRWMETLPSLIDDNVKEFVLVGTMHINGEGGLLSLLKKQGFKVEQL